MDEHNKSAADLSAQERLCLLLIGNHGLEAFNPHEDEVIVRLLDLAFVAAERTDDETSLLRLTPEGKVIAARLRDNMG
jgi:hypothetical protein